MYLVKTPAYTNNTHHHGSLMDKYNDMTFLFKIHSNGNYSMPSS